MKVLVYARFSDPKQKDGNSIERQIEMAEAYAKANGLTITEPPLIDRGRSAFKAAHLRGAMGRLLKRVTSGDLGQGDIILVEMIDRMSREKVMKAWDQLREFTRAGVTIITVGDGVHLSEANFDQQWSRMIEPLAKMAGAHDESKKKSDRTKDNWKRARDKGVGMVTALPGWLESKTGKPIKERVETVHQIFDLYLSGYGANVIAKKLNAVPVPAWGNGRKDTYSVWSSATVAKVLKNRAVMGEYQPRSGGEIVGPAVSDYFTQIIEPDTFFKAQALMKTRVFGGQGSGRKAEGAANIFRGLALCGSCRRRMNIIHGGGVRSLRCYGSRVGSCENTRGFRYEKLEEAVLKTVSEIQLSDAGSSARLRGVQSEIATVTRDIETSQANIEFLSGEALRTRSSAMTNMVVAEEAKLESLKDRLETLKGELAGLASPLSQHQSEVVSAFDKLLTADDPEELRGRINMSLTALVDKIVFTPNHNVLIHFKDATTYVLRYRLKADLPKQARVGSRPISDFEWYAGRVGEGERIDGTVATSIEGMDALDRAFEALEAETA